MRERSVPLSALVPETTPPRVIAMRQSKTTAKLPLALRRFAAIALFAVTSGCAQGDLAPQRSETQLHLEGIRNPDPTYHPEMIFLAAAEMQNVIAGCREERLSGKLKSFADSAKCSNAMIVLAYGWFNYPHMDLIRVVADTRLAVSRRVDEGKLSEIQAQMLMTELGKKVNAEILRRESLMVSDAPSQVPVSSGSTQQALAMPMASMIDLQALLSSGR
jgi:hypothetical protein